MLTLKKEYSQMEVGVVICIYRAMYVWVQEKRFYGEYSF